MKRRQKISWSSSLLVNLVVIVGMLGCALLANWANFHLLGLMLLITGLLGLLSRQWGLAALRGVKADVKGVHPAVFAGEKLTLRYRVKNDKALPLMWLEVCQDLPPNSCVAPEGGVDVLELPQDEDESGGGYRLFRQSVAFLMGGQEVEWERQWLAQRRGVYQIGRLMLRSGDGFGLTQSNRLDILPQPPTLAVWPRLVAVDGDRLLRNLWSGQSGGQGPYEDITLLKGTRAYQPTDPWKRIDWRMAARQEELQVKLYETVLPRTLHFVVDGASFLGLLEGNEELEDALSVLGSLLVDLCGRGVACGLSLPGTGRRGPVDLVPTEEKPRLEELMLQLAGFDGDSAGSLFSAGLLASLQNQVGRVFFVTHSGGRTACGDLLRQLDRGLVTALTWQKDEGVTVLSDCGQMLLPELKVGDGK